jgi:uncharacterized membrane protein YbhN (UPF0104 family)
VTATTPSEPLRARRRGLPRHVATAARTLVTLGLLSLLASRIDLRHAGTLLAGASPALAAGSVLACLAGTPVNAVRWRALCDPGDGLPPLAAFWKILMVGLFFNQMLPSGIGGDAVRAWRCQMLGIRLGAAVRSILLERASGYCVFVALLGAGLPRLAGVLDPPLLHGLLLLFAACVGGLGAMLVLDLVPGLARLSAFTAWLGELSVAARRLVAHPRQLAANLALSTISVGLTVLGFQLAGAAVGIEAGYGTWLAVVPPVALIQLVPVSLAGWGVREVALAQLLGAFAVGPEHAVAASILFGLLQIVLGLPGGVIWLAGWDVGGRAARSAA